jgi:hypothetical protein
MIMSSISQGEFVSVRNPILYKPSAMISYIRNLLGVLSAKPRKTSQPRRYYIQSAYPESLGRFGWD